MTDPRLGGGCGFATIPLRTCEGCDEQRICEDIPDKGRLCSLCKLTAECCDAVIDSDPDALLKTLVIRLAGRKEGGPPTIEELFLLHGTVVGGVLRFLIDEPHRLRVLASEAEQRALDDAGEAR